MVISLGYCDLHLYGFKTKRLTDLTPAFTLESDDSDENCLEIVSRKLDHFYISRKQRRSRIPKNQEEGGKHPRTEKKGRLS